MTAHIRDLAAGVERSRAVHDFVAFAKHVALHRGHLPDAVLHAKGATERVQRALKAASSALSTSDVSFASGDPDFRAMARAFVESLERFSAFDAIRAANGFVPIPPNTIVGTVRAGIVGHEAGESVVKLVDELDIAIANFDSMRKTAGIVVLTEDAIKSTDSAASRLVELELRKCVALGTDRLMFDVILDGTDAPSQSSSGLDVDALTEDLEWLLGQVGYGATSRLFFIVDTATARRLATATSTNGRAFPEMTIFGGRIFGVTTLVSDAATAGTITVLVADGIATSLGPVTVDSAKSATLKMVNATEDVGAAPLTSLWQQNLRAIRCERWLALQKLRDNSVAQITGVEEVSA